MSPQRKSSPLNRNKVKYVKNILPNASEEGNVKKDNLHQKSNRSCRSEVFCKEDIVKNFSKVLIRAIYGDRF